ncbi:MAG: hypothetical protein QOH69_1548 [Actinomycetota bacterium]|nr:hypothetical protein [Actinomycetota bacterium]
MNDDNGFGVPAGWYPDPLGLPQMRWWDNHGWTEHTTEARAPIVIQEAKLAWADDDAIEDLPTRRERRERERGSAEDGGSENVVPTADSLLQLEPPSWDELPANEPAPDILPLPEFVGTAPQEAPVAQPVAPAFTQSVAQAQPIHTETLHTEYAQTPVAQAPAAQPGGVHAPGTPYAAGTAPSTNTLGGWVIALLPLLQLLAILLVVSAAGSGGTNVGIILAILALPYFLSIPFAISDRRALKNHGYDNPASWLWVFLSGPIYLIARAIRIVMRAGNGFAPILVWGALVLLQVGSVVAVPGLVIAALPQTFSDQAAQSIENAATVFGPITSVTCPSPPATVMGQEFTCTLYRIGSGQTYKVTAALERENGWIAWQVHDWGDYSMTH